MRSLGIKTFITMGACMITVHALAQTSSNIEYEISAELPKASGFVCKLSQVVQNGQGQQTWTSIADNGMLEFGRLDEVENPQTGSGLGVWGPPHFFVCDIAPLGGVGIPSTIQFQYQDGANPNALAGPPYSDHGLGYKGVMSVNAVNYATNSENNLATVRYLDAAGVTVTDSDLLTGSALLGARVYFGISLGDPAVRYNIFGSPVTPAEPFTAADHHGVYNGNMIITVTMD